MANDGALKALERLRQIQATVRRKTSRELADDLIARRDGGEKLTATQADFIVAIENMAGGRPEVSGNFTPIPEHLWPPGMRNGGIARDFARELIAKHEAGQFVDPLRLTAARTLLRKTAAPTPQPETTE
jgi:hypothetical protein